MSHFLGSLQCEEKGPMAGGGEVGEKVNFSAAVQMVAREAPVCHFISVVVSLCEGWRLTPRGLRHK